MSKTIKISEDKLGIEIETRKSLAEISRAMDKIEAGLQELGFMPQLRYEVCGIHFVVKNNSGIQWESNFRPNME